MKKYLLVIALIIRFIPLLSQNMLTTINDTWSYSKICIERNVPNFIAILEMSQKDFETEMKRVGAHVRVGQDYCMVASEQRGSGSALDSPALIFNKCDDYPLALFN